MIVWESFQHPCETFLSNMKVSANRRTGDKVQFTSWKSLSDPSVGSFSSSLNVVNVPEVFVWNETRPYWRSGPWNGKIFIGIPKMKPVYLNGFRLGGDGEVWGNKKDEQIIRWTIQQSECDVYGLCGEFGICNSQRSPLCSCLRGFEPMDKEEWNRQNWTSGCVRTTPVQCGRMRNGGESGKEDGFLKFKMVKLPDFAEWSIAEEDQCRTQCLKNCS
ncbi:G-type lectin S-receptor-like serine/threonine-protein kinase [Quillaja saponaria]|uniref:G-type lectin S-receptor-like serine/threonine-protein kinase n=1 Tax=Quillaja saponaria TaxID=32244 RepID=A0AAD7M2E9_QUISA|nr:G-type lectin S-receptor-like serine/threonine-protein kinase [Quillaja saponaria]